MEQKCILCVEKIPAKKGCYMKVTKRVDRKVVNVFLCDDCYTKKILGVESKE